ncbi:hypothetical protein C7M84_007754 [Penaeus vannamei]|uniref:Monocarboxylate transporter n=1 Tax=Penaeus vannamei TaxID=6689 RepID=A0A3R7M5W4_PENVA|nr:hypothetical protein C7M84_007754 [Penaeus vannamei]
MIVPHYFTTRRGLASGIIMMWDCGGQLLGSPLVELLQDQTVGRPRTRAPGGGSGSRSSSPRPKGALLSRVVRSTLEDLRVLASARACIIAVGATVVFNGYLNFLAFVPFAMQEAGHSLGDAAACVSVSAVCNMVTRITLASLSDARAFSFRACHMLGSAAITGAMLAFTLLSDMAWIRVAMGVWGCGVGAFMSIFNLVMVHYMGLDRFMAMLGATMLLCSSSGHIMLRLRQSDPEALGRQSMLSGGLGRRAWARREELQFCSPNGSGRVINFQ